MTRTLEEVLKELEAERKLKPKYHEMLLKELKKKLDKQMKLAFKEFGEYQRKMITKIFNEAVTEFYDAYSPNKYKRRKSLYDVLEMETDPQTGIVKYDSFMDLFERSKIGADRNGFYSLFDTVFLSGYHGGATKISSEKASVWGEHPEPEADPGVAYYRKPGFATAKDGTQYWHMWGSWGKRAVKTKAVYTIVSEQLSEAQGGEIFEKFKEIMDSYAGKAVSDFQKNDMPRIKKKVYGSK